MYSCKSYQRISVLVMEYFFKLHKITKISNSDSRIVQTPSIHHIYAMYFLTQQGEIGEKIRGQHGFQNSLISQQRTSQMIRWSPPGF